MPRGKNTSNPFAALDPSDLAYALHRLVQSGKVTVAQVRAFAAERAERLASLEAELEALRSVGASGAGRAVRGGRTPRSPRVAATAKRRPVTKSAKFKASRKKQGRYLGLRRGLPAAQQREATKIAQTKGVDEALKYIIAQRAALAKKAA